MTTSKINEVIATSLGFVKTVEHYSYCGENGSVDNWTLWDNKGNKLAQGLPNYTSDLNACAVFEATLNDEQRQLYVVRLSDSIIGGDVPNLKWLNSPLSSIRMAVFATAPQRCEAYLKTMGLWGE